MAHTVCSKGHQLGKNISGKYVGLSGKTWAVSRISLWFDAVSNWQAWLFYFTVVNLTLSGVSATGNVFVKIRLQIFSQLSGSPRVIRSQTVNLPGVCPCNMTRNQKWHVTSEKRVLFFSWLTGLVCLCEPRTGLWHPPFILSAFQIFHFHDLLREWHIFRIFLPWVRTLMHQCCLIPKLSWLSLWGSIFIPLPVDKMVDMMKRTSEAATVIPSACYLSEFYR